MTGDMPTVRGMAGINPGKCHRFSKPTGRRLASENSCSQKKDAVMLAAVDRLTTCKNEHAQTRLDSHETAPLRTTGANTAQNRGRQGLIQATDPRIKKARGQKTKDTF